MELGFHIPIFDIDGGPTAIAGELARVGSAAEASGATWLSFMDHFFQIEPTGAAPRSRCSRATRRSATWPAHTSTLDLGLLVTGVTYRHPGLLAKIVTTLDVLSGGRARCSASAPPGTSGSTAASAFRSRRSPSGSSGSRRRCRSACRCGTGDNGPFEGTHYRLAETLCSPQPSAAAPAS